MRQGVGQLKTKGRYTVRRMPSGTWAVVEIRGGAIALAGFPKRIRALYAAHRLNGWVKDVFMFGEGAL